MALYFSFGIMLLTYLGIPGLTTEVFAQKFSASVNKNKVATSEIFQLDFTINANGKNFTPPSLNDFNIYSGPNQSSSVQIINGNMSQSITLSYYLSAKKEGTFTIGPASIIVGGNTLHSNSITIEVSKGNPQQQNQARSGDDDSQQGQRNNSNTLFVRTSLSKSKAYVGEQIVVSHKVYTRRNLKGFQDAKFPSYDGFFAQEPTRNAQYEITQENIDGVTYSVVEIKKAFLFPQKSGKIKIEPIEVECVVREKTGKSNDPFEQIFGNDPFFGGFSSYKDVVYNISSNAATVEVLPLPDKPSGFSGAVGDFSMNAVIDKEQVKENEAINLKITISGKGNLKLIDPPSIEFPSEFETYDPKTNENINTTSSGVSGSKTFEYLIIPRHEGIYKLPAINFQYFNADKKNYTTLPSKEFEITVTKGDGNTMTNMPITSGTSKEDVKMVGNDIRFIKTNNIDLIKKGDYFFKSPGFIAGFALPPLLFFAFLLFRREYIRKNSDLVAVKRRRASHLAKKQLMNAEKAIKTGDKENFYTSVLSALYTYVGNKANIPAADMSKDKVSEVLKEKYISDETIHELIKLLDECEFARFAPGLQSGNLNEVYNRSENIITKIENAIA